jgi:RNA polymerase sigma factor (sigma-70 family)
VQAATPSRQALIENHLALVPPIARRVHRRLPPSFDLDDLIGCGYVGLVDAAARYRPREHGGAPFSAFARRRIHGAIVDSVRRRAWVENTAGPLEDAAEPACAPSLPFLIRGDISGDMPPRRGRCLGAFREDCLPKPLARALRALPLRQRAILGAVYGDGERSLAETAAQLHLTVQQARAEERAALRALHAAMVKNVSLSGLTLVFFAGGDGERRAA